MFYMLSLSPRNRNAINLLPFWAAKPEAKFHGGPLDRDCVWYFCDGIEISFLKAISIEEQHGHYCSREKAVNVFRINQPFLEAQFHPNSQLS
jgi:hypothetical protein